jgi:hypothetical protein
MTEVAEQSSALASEWDRIRSLDDDALNAELATVLQVTAGNIARLALILRAKEERGHDLSSLNIGMLDFLRLVAQGRLQPEAVVNFGHRKSVLKRFIDLPADEQRRYATGAAPLPPEWTERYAPKPVERKPVPVAPASGNVRRFRAEIVRRGIVRAADQPTFATVTIDIADLQVRDDLTEPVEKVLADMVDFLLPEGLRVRCVLPG